jgi:UDPglucose--hexose-1-phosphate uridylyltransferase
LSAVDIASARAKRPHDFDFAQQRHKGRFCPFCEGHEDKTPGEIIAYRNAGSQRNREGWRIRVVPKVPPWRSKAI